MKTAEPTRVVRGKVLFREGEPGDSCYWVVKGTVKISVHSDYGDERIFAFLGPGSVVGELAILDGRPRSATATAFSDANLTVLKRAALRAYLNDNPSVWTDLVSILTGRLRETDRALSATSFLPMHARVARAILDLCEHVGEPADGSGFCFLPATVSLHDISAVAGVARESVSRVLTKWKPRGIAVRDRGRRLRVNRDKLEHEATES